MFRFEPPDPLEIYGIMTAQHVCPQLDEDLETMSSRSFESLASSKDSSEDCLRVRLGEVLVVSSLPHLTYQ